METQSLKSHIVFDMLCIFSLPKSAAFINTVPGDPAAMVHVQAFPVKG